MAFVRVCPSKDAPAGRVRMVSKAVCGAITGTAAVPVSGKAGIDGPGTFVNPIAGEV